MSSSKPELPTHPPVILPEPVVQSVALDGLEALEVEHALRELLAGRVAVHNCMQIRLASLQDSLQQQERASVTISGPQTGPLLSGGKAPSVPQVQGSELSSRHKGIKR
jgi:hypothetical protein